MTRGEFILRSAIFVAIALAPFLIWLLFNVIVLATGAVLVATLIHLVATPFIKLRLPRGMALALSGLLIASVIGATFYLFGRTMASEFHDVLRSAEETADSISLAISRSGLSDYLPKSFSENVSLSGVIGRSFTISVEAVLGALVAFFAGVFLASEPALYSEGFTLLFAPRWRDEARETLGHVSTALRRWLLGQMIEMVTVGVMAGVAVWLIGLPSPFALGAISGLSEFIPYIGPILAIFPSVAVAATIGPYAMLWTILAYLAIHQLDGNMIMPLIQRQLVRVPPALMLISIATFGTLFGLGATIFAAPLTVVIYVAVIKLYLRDTLGERTPLPGEGAGPKSLSGAL
jgi:predicted PurR-regulated permease PerM